MTAVKSTAEACRKGAALLEALLIDYEARDVFVNAEYASQLKRLHAASSQGAGLEKRAAAAAAVVTAAAAAAAAEGGGPPAGNRRGLPDLPQLYANGNLIGGLSELTALDDEGKLASTLAPYRIEHQRGLVDTDRGRGCDECGGKRFVVCNECNGSRRGRKVFDKYLKCSHCNENGLMVCSACK